MKMEWKSCFKIGTSLFLLYLCVTYWQSAANVAGLVLGAAMPLLIGCIIAYLVNILVSCYEMNELGSFSVITDGVIFHNTLASSDYSFMKHGTFEPRPNYFAVLLWNTLMGTTVYDCGNPDCEGAHAYCHSRRDEKDGCVYLVINNSLKDTTTVELPKDAEVYSLSGNGDLRSSVAYLNGEALVIGENNTLPELHGETRGAGVIELAPGSCAFIVL